MGSFMTSAKVLGPLGIAAFERREIDVETVSRFGISIDDLRRRFRYNRKTGALTWKIGPLKGMRAGSIQPDGYRRVYVGGARQMYSGVICFAIAHGRWAHPEVDHKNRIRDDDRFANLREATRAENVANRSAWASSGHAGIYRDGKKWRATRMQHGHRVYLGRFATADDALRAQAKQ